MENASKALLIAGSVLVAIMLIAVGMRVLNAGSTTINQQTATTETMAITQFNAQFAGYLDKPITATQATSLVQKIIANNATNSKKVKFKGSLTIPSTAAAGTYKADYSSGYISNIHL